MKIRLRFSLATLMCAVCASAFACAALRFASELWASLVFTVTFGLLLVGVLGVALRQGPARAFWLGFSVFGWAYVVLAFGWFGINVSHQLLTTKLLAYALPKLQQTANSPAIVAVSSAGQVYSVPLVRRRNLPLSPDEALVVAAGADKTVKLWNATTVSLPGVQLPSWDHFQRVGHSLFGLLIALVGGLSAVLISHAGKIHDRTA